MNDSLISKLKTKYKEYIETKELIQKEKQQYKQKLEIEELKKIYKNENIDEMFFRILRLNESKIKKEENVIYTTFKYLVENKINIDIIYKQFPIFLEEYLKNEIENKNITNLEKKIINTFRNNILNVKLFLFKNIEDNLDEFKEFKKHFDNKNLNEFDEIQVQLMVLSFYLFKHSLNFENQNITNDEKLSNSKNDFDIQRKIIKNNIKNSINEAKKLIELNFINTLLPTKDELDILEKSEKHLDLKFGLEYEFWMKFELKNYIDKFENVLNKFNLIDKNIKKNSNIDNKYEIHKIVNEEIKDKKVEQHYFEIITKKFDSISEMLIFHNLILNSIKQFHIESFNDIKFKNTSILENEKNIIDEKNKIFINSPGSIHFNISIKDIENIDKVKFFLFLKESGKMQEWGIRNTNVKNLSSLVDVFGKDVLNLKLGYDTFDNSLGKFWTVNFEHLFDSNLNNKRIEIRYIGGENYFNKEKLILNNFLDIINCVIIGNNPNLEFDNYLKYQAKYENSKEFNELKKDEHKFLRIFFNVDTIGEIFNLYDKIKTKIINYKESIKK